MLPAMHDSPEPPASLQRRLRPFACEDRARSWWGLLSTVAVQLLLWGALLALPHPAVRLYLGTLIGLVMVRFFILFHDYAHGAIFRGSRLGGWAMTAVAIYTRTPASTWRKHHNFHHAHNSKLDGNPRGGFPVVSTTAYPELSETRRRVLHASRNPLVLLGAVFTLFELNLAWRMYFKDPESHRDVPVGRVLWLLGAAGIWAAFGWEILLFGLLWPMALSSAVGAWLFFAQHTAPGLTYQPEHEWSRVHAALHATSHFEMTRWMHWLTGNIGYHNVHHLNVAVPWYNLPAARAALPELVDGVRTSWRLRDMAACLRCGLYDVAQGVSVPFPAGALSQAVATSSPPGPPPA